MEDAQGPNVGAAVGRGILIGGALFVLSLVVAAFGLVSYAKGYLRSAAFRQNVEREISSVLKARAELEPIQWEGSSAYTNRLRAAGYQDAAFGSLELAGFRAELDLGAAQFRRGVWKVPEIVVNQVDVDLSQKLKLPGAFPSANEASEEPAKPRQGSRNGLLASLIPNRVEVDIARISALNVLWEEADGRRAEAAGMQTMVKPTPAMDAFQVELRGGSIRRPGQEKLEIDRIDLRTKKGDVYLSEALLRTASGAEIEVEGDILSAANGKPGSLLLQVGVDHLQVEDVVADAWTQKVRGDLRIRAKIAGDPSQLGQLSQTGTIILDKGILEAFPFLDTLATYTGSERFRRLALRDGASAQFQRNGNHTVIDQIDVQSDGLARLTGTIEIQDKALSGRLRLGIIPGTASWLPGAEQKIFLVTENGYLWTDIILSGTMDAPQNDLVPRLAAAGVESAIETIQNPAAIKQSVEGAIGVGRDLLNGLLGR